MIGHHEDKICHNPLAHNAGREHGQPLCHCAEEAISPLRETAADIHEPDAATSLLRQYGIEDNQKTRAQLYHFMVALRIYDEREQGYRDAWKRDGWRGNLAKLLTKAERLREMFWRGDIDGQFDPVGADDAYDLLNYVVFFLRNAEEGNEWGH